MLAVPMHTRYYRLVCWLLFTIYTAISGRRDCPEIVIRGRDDRRDVRLLPPPTCTRKHPRKRNCGIIYVVYKRGRMCDCARRKRSRPRKVHAVPRFAPLTHCVIRRREKKIRKNLNNNNIILLV